jgi:DNA-binding response OmpR family regulator
VKKRAPKRPGFSSALVVVDRAAQLGQVRSTFAEIGITCVITERPTRDHAAYVERNDAVTVVLTSDDPLSRLAYLRMVGVRGAVVVLYSGKSDMAAKEVLEAGAAAVESWPLDAAALSSVLSRIDHRRRTAPEGPQLDLDSVGRLARWHGEEVQLTPKEFAMIHLLSKRAGHVVRTQELKTYVWGDSLPKRSGGQIVTVYVSRLRQKLRAVGLRNCLRTVPRVGYVLDLS